MFTPFEVGNCPGYLDDAMIGASGKLKTFRALVEQELIVIPAHARADGPIAKANEILGEGGGLKVPTARCEGRRRGRRAVVELGGIGDGIAELLVQKGGVGFDEAFRCAFFGAGALRA